VLICKEQDGFRWILIVLLGKKIIVSVASNVDFFIYTKKKLAVVGHICTPYSSR
jgi:hypothetical protein